MKWRTAISTQKDKELYVRGSRLTDLIKKASFIESIFLILRGQFPKKKEAKILEAVFVSMIEHGVEVPSAFIARSVASTGNSPHTALAAGILAMGDFHGGAIEQAARYIQSKETPRAVVTQALKNKERLPGYGHKVYKAGDPRVRALLEKTQELQLSQTYIKRARAIERELKRASGISVPLNIDGAVAAVISELGFDWQLGKSFFVLGRLPGLIAHVAEEQKNEKPYRRLDSDDIEYIGPPF
ncbi:MAG: citryl-CoA lyase [Candidatus Ryanbacteria bacterium CG10_big_fil_rev_8_21_14_0_10_43_42]|uniref:citrate synthase (unknown stereospecificity) n=1 Tax=Candidatus Ryanbacteria bacterium CG10_big_fil_rev_8_21_14_0_10_43_42 TaxID=1974864 RepID=A0A2M8KXL6_9BACT|nr:MAG: citryl-CoA lyase [Candidatus Ryanbacteria bacterium CG10_big_fil_rev_8_21_14_0_10_43_42]